jgi:hypothetical protein
MGSLVKIAVRVGDEIADRLREPVQNDVEPVEERLAPAGGEPKSDMCHLRLARHRYWANSQPSLRATSPPLTV